MQVDLGAYLASHGIRQLGGQDLTQLVQNCTSSSVKLKVAHSDARKRPSARQAGGDSDLSYLRADSAGQPPVRAFREGPYLRGLFPVVR